MIQEKSNIHPKLEHKYLLLMVLLGVIGMSFGLVYEPARAWIMFLTANFYFFCLGLFGTFLLAISYVVSASYIVPYRRILEGMAATTPLTGFLMLGILFGVSDLYEWNDPGRIAHDAVLHTKLAYLNFPFFAARAVIGVLILSGISCALVLKSRKQDQFPERAEEIEMGLKSFSAVSLPFLALSLTMVTFDWIMSIQAHWYSTIYGILVFSGLMSYGFAFCILALNYLEDKTEIGTVVNENHYHDLGKWLFGMTTFWAYIWYSQYLLIWYANIPEAAEYFYLRGKYGWSWPFWLNVIINWVVPFIILLPRWTKRNKMILTRVCWIVMLGQLFNLYIMVAPKILYNKGIYSPAVSWFEIFVVIGLLGVFLLNFIFNLNKASIIAKNSPFLEEGAMLEQ